MKRGLLLLSVVLALPCAVGVARARSGNDLAGARRTLSPHKRALLIGVSGYDHHQNGDAVELDTARDVDALREVLIHHLGFASDDITVLKKPEETTHKAIVEALRDLIARTQPGDDVFIHYSGHGSEVDDPNDAEGHDQTLVPSDYKHDRSIKGSNDIRDKEIAELLTELKQRQPGSVTLTFDSCHSGTITRGGRMLVREYVRPTTSPTPTALGGSPKGGGLIADAENLGYVVLSACRSDQLDSQIEDDNGKPMGSLSYALCKALAEANDKTTHRDLFERVTSILRAKGMDQDPQIEGEVDRVLFGKGAIRPEPSILVALDENQNPRLQAGSLMDVTKDSKLDLYVAGTKDFKTAHPIAHATVSHAEATESALDIQYLPGHGIKEIDGARALLTERCYTDQPLQVDLSGLQGHPQQAAILTAMADLKKGNLVAVAPTGGKTAWDVRIAPAADAITRGVGQPLLRGADPSAPGSLVLQRADGTFLIVQTGNTYAQVLGDTPDLPMQIGEALRRESRRRLLSALPGQTADLPFKVEMRLIPCDTVPDGPKSRRWTADLLLPMTEGYQADLAVGGYFRVELRCTGIAPAYVTILDISSDGTIVPLWPHPKLGRVINVVQNTREWIPIRNTWDNRYTPWHLTEPTGSETFTVIATEQPADFSPLFDIETLNARGAPRGDDPGVAEAQTPLGKLFLSAATRTRSAPTSVPTGGWGTYSLHIRVVPVSGK